MKENTIILAVLMSLICMAGCASSKYEPYTSMVCDTTNDEYAASIETDIWNGLYFEKNSMADKSCEVYGKTYIGKYEKSIREKLDSYTTDIYYDEKNVQFGFRSDTGELVYLNLMNKEFFSTEPYLSDISNPEESAITLATEIAKEYVKNIDEYTMINHGSKTSEKEKDGKTYEITYYLITYAKKIGDYYTSDYITIKTTSKGNIATIKIGDLNAFEDETIDFDIPKMTQSITDKTRQVYQDKPFKVEKINTSDQKIVLTPDGYVCMYSQMSVEGMDGDIEMKTGVCMLTVLKKKGQMKN